MTEEELIKSVNVWRVTARFYAEMEGEFQPPSREEWADLARTLIAITEIMEGGEIDDL